MGRNYDMIAAAILLATFMIFRDYSPVFTKEKEPVIREIDSPPQQPDSKAIAPPPTNSDNFNVQAESIKQNTEGNQSPAVIGKDVSINYSDDWGLDEEEENKMPPKNSKTMRYYFIFILCLLVTNHPHMKKIQVNIEDIQGEINKK